MQHLISRHEIPFSEMFSQMLRRSTDDYIAKVINQSKEEKRSKELYIISGHFFHFRFIIIL